jgi:hypothetical protein
MTTKAKLTKAQKARAKRALIGDFRNLFTFPSVAVGINEPAMLVRTSAEWSEVERLLLIAIEAVERAR